jgi:hypothetical protein
VVCANPFAGYATVTVAWSKQLPLLVLAALTGAVIGPALAVRRVAPVTLRRVLGLVIAGVKC